MAIKTNNAGIITHNSQVFSERGRSFGLAALKNSPLGMRPNVPPPPPTLGDYIYNNKSPTILYDYATLFNRGSHLNGNGIVMTNSTHTVTTEYQGLSGYIENERLSSTNIGYVTADNSGGGSGGNMFRETNFSEDKSYLFVVSSQAMNIPDNNGPFINSYRGIVGGGGNFYSRTSLTIAKSLFKMRGTSAFEISPGIGKISNAYSHTDGGSSEVIVPATATAIFLVLLSFDASEEELTYRWKQLGHRSGHSYYVESRTVNTSTTNGANDRLFLLGYGDTTGARYSGGEVRVHLNALYKSTTTAEEFDQYANILGL